MSKSIFIPDIAAKVAKIFQDNGGQFITPAKEIAEKVSKISCFVFDWDGVFNTGRKGAEKTSDFAEPDTMALHIIRYAYWRKHGVLPIVAIITGVDNESAYKLAQRDHLTHVFAGFKDKTEPLKTLQLFLMILLIIPWLLVPNFGLWFAEMQVHFLWIILKKTNCVIT
ncbi:MAG: hypothetical protein EAZ53_13310 [Bacteroidetes bacterium]|nr:MAG: hypothetical protein EAZ53_13310 [Bacteroidota bacterium]